MIIWLASYPRSGNTLLRTILKHCLNQFSYADELVYQQNPLRNNPELVGHIERSEPWEIFYERACNSRDVVLVKTHNLPRDNQPFIYIVRDGRSAVQSYRQFHLKYNKVDKSLVRIILGDDVYADWATHYYQWNLRPVKKLSLRFEDIVNISKAQLEQLADFIGYKGEVKPWRNPIENLRGIEPDFFNKGNTHFVPGEEWTEAVGFLFNKLYQVLMAELGYGKNLCPDPAVNPLTDAMINELIRLTQCLLNEKSELSHICNERNELIHKLQGICEERLQLINQLHQSINLT